MLPEATELTGSRDWPMTDLDTRCLDAFPEWLKTLASDALGLAGLLENKTLPESVRRAAAAAVNYLFKSLDLIPDGIEDLGFIDDAFVFRAAAASSLAADAGAADVDDTGTLARLAGEARLVREVLGEDADRLDRLVGALKDATVRGRSVDAILADDEVRVALTGDLRGWAAAYQVPSFTRDRKNLVKLRSFLAAKLPA